MKPKDFRRRSAEDRDSEKNASRIPKTPASGRSNSHMRLVCADKLDSTITSTIGHFSLYLPPNLRYPPGVPPPCNHWALSKTLIPSNHNNFTQKRPKTTTHPQVNPVQPLTLSPDTTDQAVSFQTAVKSVSNWTHFTCPQVPKSDRKTALCSYFETMTIPGNQPRTEQKTTTVVGR